MKQILTAAVMLVLVPFLGLSQELSKDFTVTVGTPYEVIDAGSKEYIALDDNFAIMAKMGNGIVNLQKYDFNRMKEVSRNTYQDLPKKAVFQDIIKIKDQVFYIYEAYDKKAKSFTVYSRQINTEDASFQKPVELFKTSRKVANSPSTGELSRVSPTNNPFKVGGNKFLVYQSFDKSKTMISYRCTPVNKDANVNHDIIGFYV
ncbi:MAG: hypothetical protein MI810_16210, partial [Flavobacteriales bacterium]|nr:hypothetical protein [Flavobacteriales bacterium]